MHLKSLNFFYILFLLKLRVSSGIRIENGKVTVATSVSSSSDLEDSSVTPISTLKFSPSQQILTDLLTPQQVSPSPPSFSKVKIHNLSVKALGKKRERNAHSFVPTTPKSEWNLVSPSYENSKGNGNGGSELFRNKLKERMPMSYSSHGFSGSDASSSVNSNWVGIRRNESGSDIPIPSFYKQREEEGTTPTSKSTQFQNVQPRLPVQVQEIHRIGSYSHYKDKDEEEDDEDFDSRSEEERKKPKKKSKYKGRKEEVDSGIDSKIQRLEDLITALNKNVDVMRQNTQVISKGFNILSTRFNKLSADQDELNLKLDKKFVLMEEGMIRMQKEVGKKIRENEAKMESGIKSLRKTDSELLESQVRNGQEHKKWVDSISARLQSFKSSSDNESKVIAEMVKALAEIQKKEKTKLDSFLKKELKITAAPLHNTSTTFRTAVGNFQQEVSDLQESFRSETELLKKELVDLSKYVEERVKRIEENYQEQNMAHNLAHEHIGEKMSKLESLFKTGKKHRQSDKSAEGESEGLNIEETSMIVLLEKMQKLERNLTKIDRLFEKTDAMEDTDLSILSRIADIRNTQVVENSITKSEIHRLSQQVNETIQNCRGIGDRFREISDTKAKSRKGENLRWKLAGEDGGLLEIGGLSMTDPTSSSPEAEENIPTQSLILTTDHSLLRSSLNEASTPSEIDPNILTRLNEMENRLADIHRAEEGKANNNNNQEFSEKLDSLRKVTEQKQAETNKAVRTIAHTMQNNTKRISELESQIELLKSKEIVLLEDSDDDAEAEPEVSEEISARVKTSPKSKSSKKKSSLKGSDDLDLLRGEIDEMREKVEEMQRTNKNVTKAQEFFLLKLLDIDQEHTKTGKSLQEDLQNLKMGKEDTLLEIARSEERLNKVVQQFAITDAEQAKIREELVNIKDRLAGLEENYINLWKNNKKVVGELEQVMNNVDNLNLIHGSELRTLSTEKETIKGKLSNVTATLKNLENRMSNAEVLMDIDAASDKGKGELSKLKSRLSATEKDIQELWKSSEILSFQQQVVAENFKHLESSQTNSTSLLSVEGAKLKFEASSLLNLYENLTQKISQVEKLTSPPFEIKTINFMIPDWYAVATTGLSEEFVEYEIGSILGIRSTWKAHLQLNGTYISVVNELLNTEMPMFNELEVQFLDGDGKAFLSVGPEQNLYRGKGSKSTLSNIISLSTLENLKNGLLFRNTLRVKLKARVYPKHENGGEGGEKPAAEKQLIQWEVRNLGERLQLLNGDEMFTELNITKDFAAGFAWNGLSLWKLNLLVKTINRQEYLGIDVELIQTDGDWKELIASYNVTMLDSYSRIVKEFSISPNDFLAVSARHSYFMLVRDVLEILKQGDLLTLKVHFNLQAKRKVYEVEVIK